MDENDFWEIIADARDASNIRGGDARFEIRLDSLRGALSALELAELKSFVTHFHHAKVRAFRWELWAAAYVIGGGCSDDAFADFRNWLISMGREVYESALLDADSLADVHFGADGEADAFFEEFGYVPNDVLKKAVDDSNFESLYSAHPNEPAGAKEVMEASSMRNLLPRLCGLHE